MELWENCTSIKNKNQITLSNLFLTQATETWNGYSISNTEWSWNLCFGKGEGWFVYTKEAYEYGETNGKW